MGRSSWLREYILLSDVRVMLCPSPLVPGLVLTILLGFLLFLKHQLSWRKDSSNVTLRHEGNSFNQKLISLAPLLRSNYFPPYWLRFSSQTALHVAVNSKNSVAFGRRMSEPVAVRKKIDLPDGTNTIFDLYLHPLVTDPLLENVLLVVIPGISNHSECNYIRNYIEYSSSQGFKVACYNHSATLPSEDLIPSAPRMFTYGGTGDLSAMMDHLVAEYPDMKYIGIGFSLGANILLKYLGEKPERQTCFLAAQSCCQGYDAARCIPSGNRLAHGGFLFNFLLATRQRALISNRFLHKLFNGPPMCSNLTGVESEPSSSEAAQIDVPLPDWAPTYAYRRGGRERGERDSSRDVNGFLMDGWDEIPPFDFNKFKRARNLLELDSTFTCPLLGFKNPIEMYRWSSSYYVMDRIQNFPILLVNSRDDPLVPCWIAEEIVDDYCRTNTRAVSVFTSYGGHLGFFEGGLSCEALTWLDKVSIQHAKAVVQLKSS